MHTLLLVPCFRTLPTAAAHKIRANDCRLAQGDDADSENESPGEASRKLAAVHEAVDAFFRDADPQAVLDISPPRSSMFRAAFARLKSLSRWAGAGKTSLGQDKEVQELRASVARLQMQASSVQCQMHRMSKNVL